MATKRETALVALFAKLTPLASASRKIERNAPVPASVPDDGYVIQRDGEMGDPVDTILGEPPEYVFEHRVEIECIFQRAEEATRDAGLDALLALVGAAVEADRRLGETIDWLEVMAPETLDVNPEGADPLKGATVPVILHYTSNSPLG